MYGSQIRAKSPMWIFSIRGLISYRTLLVSVTMLRKAFVRTLLVSVTNRTLLVSLTVLRKAFISGALLGIGVGIYSLWRGIYTIWRGNLHIVVERTFSCYSYMPHYSMVVLLLIKLGHHKLPRRIWAVTLLLLTHS
jgi:hypothetical protein